MKIFSRLFLFVLASFALFVLAAHASPILVGGSSMTVNGTSNCVVTAQVPQDTKSIQQYSIQHGVLTNTNQIQCLISNTLDGVNYTYGYTWYASFTNATTEYIYAGTVSQTVSNRLTVVTTNSQSVIINYGQ